MPKSRGESVPRSASVQMYLLSILRLGQVDEPVPLSQLAATLGVSPVSVNQMCRRLEDEGFVTYIPYKGVSITSAGAELAGRILRRHRLWEVFLVDQLHVNSGQAHGIACRLEHATSDQLAERLSAYLGNPQTNPEGEPIPESSGQILPTPAKSLNEMKAGSVGYCVRCTSDEASRSFLSGQGLKPGAPITIVAMAASSVLLELDGKRLSLSRNLAETVLANTDRPHEELATRGTTQFGDVAARLQVSSLTEPEPTSESSKTT